MINKESILFISVIVFFTFLLLIQLIAVGHFIFGNKKQKRIH